MSKKSKKIARNILSSFLAFFLTVLLTVGTLLVSIYTGFFMKGKILDGLNYKDYYAGVEEYFYQDVKDMSIPSGLPEEVLDGIVDSQTIHEDVKGYVLAVLDGKEYVFRTEGMQKKLSDNIYAYFQDENVQMSELQEKTIPQYVQTVADRYEEDLKVPLLTYIYKARCLCSRLFVAVGAGILLIGGAIVFSLIRLYRWKHRGLRYVIYSTIATSVMVATPAFAARISGFYKRIGISAKHLYNAFVAYVENGINMLFYMAVGWIIITCILLFFVSYLKKNGKRRA